MGGERGAEPGGTRAEYTVEPGASGERIDAFLARQPGVPSRAYAQRLLAGGHVLVGGRAVKASHRVRAGDRVTVALPEPRKPDLSPQAIPLEVLYEDEHLIVVNKPRGMVVHPAPGNPEGTLVHALLAHCGELSGIGGVRRPGIVHRLDKDTSGAIVAAKTEAAHLGLARQIKDRTARRIYWALVHGHPRTEAGTVDAPIGRHPVHRQRMAVVPGGRPAVTHFRVLERFPGFSLVEARLETGRTHQVRVHLAFIGHPVAGDTRYGPRRPALGLEGQALHARVLEFVHPVTGRPVRVEAPLPDDLASALERLRRGRATS